MKKETGNRIPLEQLSPVEQWERVFVMVVPMRCPSLNQLFSGRLQRRLALVRVMKQLGQASFNIACRLQPTLGGTSIRTISVQNTSSIASLEEVCSHQTARATLQRWRKKSNAFKGRKKKERL